MTRRARTFTARRRRGWAAHLLKALLLALAVAASVVVSWLVSALVPSPWHFAVLAVLFVLGYGTFEWFIDPRRGFE